MLALANKHYNNNNNNNNTGILSACVPVCVCVSVSVCLSVHYHIFGKYTSNLYPNFCVCVTYGRGSFLLCRRSAM